MIQHFKFFGVTAAVVSLAGLAAIYVWPFALTPRGDALGLDVDVKESSDANTFALPEPERWVETLIDDLVVAGWDAQAARAVVDLNAEWLSIQREENPARFKRQVTALLGLGRYKDLSDLLIAHPETAGLLAGVDDPALVADSLKSKSEWDYNLIANCYVQRPAPRDVVMLAEAIAKHRDVIVDFLRRGLIGGESIFIFDRKPPADTPAKAAEAAEAAKEYDRWLHDALKTRNRWSDDQRASFVNFVMRQGSNIRRRMRSDPTFAARFQNVLWPRLCEVADRDGGMYEKYLDDDRIWDLLSLDDGEKLLLAGGPLAIDLIYGNREDGRNPYPQEYHKQVAKLITTEDARAFEALYHNRDKQPFHRLISRELSPDTLRAAFDKLLVDGVDQAHLLNEWADITDDKALAEHLGPPPTGLITWVPLYYTVYEVPKKLLQGRDPTAMEWMVALADPAFLVIDLATAGQGKVARDVIVKGGEAVAKKEGEKLVVTTLKNRGLKMAEKQLATKGAGDMVKKGVGKLSDRGLSAWTVTETFGQMQSAVGKAVGKATTFEITKPVQFAFRYSGVGRESFKRFTGLEARLFMRGDARVFVRLPNLAGAVVGSRTAVFFERTAGDLALGVVAETEPGQKAVDAGNRAFLSTGEQLAVWRRHVSAWWLLNAEDEFTRKGETP